MSEPLSNESGVPSSGPRNVVVVLLDSLNRHLLGSYGGDEFDTPNLDRFAARSLRFTEHRTGSLPCMPARHDILCGSLDFLWRPWGSIEIWEDAVTYQLRQAGVTTMLVSDHPHLFEVGGENYHCDFTAWDYVRGGEGDPWRTRADPSWVGTPALPAAPGQLPHAYDTTRTWFREEEDFPGPRTMSAAADWLDRNAGQHDRFMLFVDEFDPHEPFDTPEPWASRYDPDWEGPHLIWPPYLKSAIAKGRVTPREAQQIRANYGAKLSMIDHWFAKLLDTLDRHDLWDDTAVIVCTDHGHYLGEHDVFGKPAVPVYSTLGHIPLMIAWPGHGPGVNDALTTSVDLHATICDVFGVQPEHRTHGSSLVPLLNGQAESVRDHVLTGYWGSEVFLVDRQYNFGRAAAGDNFPLALWSNRWSTMPIYGFPDFRLPRPDQRAALATMPGSDVPVIRQPFEPGDSLPFWANMGQATSDSLFDQSEDPTESHNLASEGSTVETELVERLRVALQDIEAPAEQFERLGIS